MTRHKPEPEQAGNGHHPGRPIPDELPVGKHAKPDQLNVADTDEDQNADYEQDSDEDEEDHGW